MEERNERRAHRKRVLQACVMVLILLLLFGAVIWALYVWENADQSAGDDSDFHRATMHQGDALYNLRDDVESYLVIGLDKYEMDIDEENDGYRNHQQSDFLLLLLVNRQEKTCQMIQLNRDTMTKVPILGITGEVAGERVEQLALAHTYGSVDDDAGKKRCCRNTVQAVSNLLYQTPIDHYIAVTMEAVRILNDEVGGVTVTVLDDFSQVDSQLVKGKTMTLHGQQALTYIRGRYAVGDQTNISRMKRQRQYMDAFRETAIRKVKADSGFSLQTALKLTDYTVTDCKVNQLADLANCLSEYEFSEIITPDGESVKGEEFMEFYVDDEALQQLVLELFYEKAE